MEVTGDLTMHGETKPVTFTLKGGNKAEFPKGVQRTGYSTELVLKRTDFGVGKPNPGLGDDVHVAISFEGMRRRIRLSERVNVSDRKIRSPPMPDPILIVAAMGLAGAASAVLLWICGWPWRAARPTRVNAGWVLGVGVGFILGCLHPGDLAPLAATTGPGPSAGPGISGRRRGRAAGGLSQSAAVADLAIAVDGRGECCPGLAVRKHIPARSHGVWDRGNGRRPSRG